MLYSDPNRAKGKGLGDRRHLPERPLFQRGPLEQRQTHSLLTAVGS